MTILDDFAALASLKKQYAAQKKTIDMLEASQRELGERIRVASEIKEVTKNGVALTATVASLKREGGYASTVLACDGCQRRTADAYKKRGAHHKGWAVKINSWKGCSEAFYGGRVLGLGDAWSKAKAVRVALAWLTSGKILEDQANGNPTS